MWNMEELLRAVVALPIAASLTLGAAASASQSAAGAPDTITLSGCVDRLPNGIFVLNHARITGLGDAASPGAPASPQATGTSGVTGKTGPAGAAATADVGDGAASAWALDSREDLAPHVGHRVQLIGKPREVAPTAPRADDANGSGGSPGGSSRIAIPTHRVEIRSLRMISMSCP